MKSETIPDTETPKADETCEKWLANLKWNKWDKQLEEDIEAGKLDFLIEEALLEKAQNILQPL